jgi:UDP-N-acetylmuramyl pentapeptide synthase
VSTAECRPRASRQTFDFELDSVVGNDVDTPFVAVLITRTALCAACIARHAGLPVHQVDAAIGDVKRSLQVTSGVAACEACRNRTVVYRLG